MKYFSSYEEFESFFRNAFVFVVNNYFKEENFSHSLDHTLRVINNVGKLCKKLGGFIDIGLLSALFHDVARAVEKETGVCHAKLGAEIAKDYLIKVGKSNLSKEVHDAIITHRFSNGLKPTTIEGKILQDADALDALGAIGLYRTIAHSIENKTDLKNSIKHFYEKLFLLPERMHFKISKKLALKRKKLMKEYVKEIEKELEELEKIHVWLSKLE